MAGRKIDEHRRIAERLERVAKLLSRDRPGIAADVRLGAASIKDLIRSWQASKNVNRNLWHDNHALRAGNEYGDQQ